MDILLGLQGYFPVFTLSILTCPQGLDLREWRGQAEAGSMSQIKRWRNSALCFPSNTFYPQGEQSRAKLSIQTLQRSFSRREQNSGQKQKGSIGPLWKTSVLAELGSSYLQVNSLPCNRVINHWTNIMHVPTHNIYREFCSAMRGAKGNQCTMKIPLKRWLTVREPCSPMQYLCAIKLIYHLFFFSFPLPATLIALPWRFWNKISYVHIQSSMYNWGRKTTPYLKKSLLRFHQTWNICHVPI